MPWGASEVDDEAPSSVARRMRPLEWGSLLCWWWAPWLSIGGGPSAGVPMSGYASFEDGQYAASGGRRDLGRSRGVKGGG